MSLTEDTIFARILKLDSTQHKGDWKIYFKIDDRNRKRWYTHCHKCDTRVSWNGISNIKYHLQTPKHCSNAQPRKESILEHMQEVDSTIGVDDYDIYHNHQQTWMVGCGKCNTSFKWSRNRFVEHLETHTKKREREDKDQSFQDQLERVVKPKLLKDLLLEKFRQDEAQSVAEYSFKPYTDNMVAKMANQIKEELN